MKVRHKQSGAVVVGHFIASLSSDPTDPPERYWLSEDGSRYDEREWDVVEPTWVDVTDECGLSANQEITHGLTCIGKLYAEGGRYRFRKVPLTVRAQWPDAFIIERKEPA